MLKFNGVQIATDVIGGRSAQGKGTIITIYMMGWKGIVGVHDSSLNCCRCLAGSPLKKYDIVIIRISLSMSSDFDELKITISLRQIRLTIFVYYDKNTYMTMTDSKPTTLKNMKDQAEREYVRVVLAPMKRNGATLREMAQATGLSHEQVRILLNKYGEG